MVYVPAPPISSHGKDLNPTPYTIPKGSVIIRIYTDPSKYPTGPVYFRPNGPHARFDHHIGEPYKHPRKTKLKDEESVPILKSCNDPTRGIIYGAPNLSCCIAETFFKNGRIRIDNINRWVARINVERDLKLLDVRGDEAFKIGANASISSCSHYMGQAWSRFFYTDPIFADIDGVYYSGAHNGEDAIALYERASDGISLQEKLLIDDKKLKIELLTIIDRFNAVVTHELFDKLNTP